MKRPLIAVLLALAGIGAFAFYYWQQATQLPSWYTANQIAPTGQTDSAVGTNSTASGFQSETDQVSGSDRAQSGNPKSAKTNPAPGKLNSGSTGSTPLANTNQSPKAQLRSTELTQLFTNEVTRKVESRKLGSALKGANTTLQNGTVESGAVVNLGNVAPDQLPPDERAFFSKLIVAFPELSRQNFYIGVEGKPTVKNGRVKLDDNMRIKVGKLSFTPAQLSQRLGIPEDQIRQQLQLQVQLGNVKVDDLQLADDRALNQKIPN